MRRSRAGRLRVALVERRSALRVSCLLDFFQGSRIGVTGGPPILPDTKLSPLPVRGHTR